MSLPVPLTVRVGDRIVTQEVQSLTFRKEAVGGVRSISCTLARPLTDLDGIVPLSKFYVYDGRSAVTIAEGRLADTGRSAGSDGQTWGCAAFGPLQHASDVSHPLIYVDRGLDWQRVDVTHVDATMSTGAKPGDSSSTAAQGLLAHFPRDAVVVPTDRVVLQYERIWQTGQKIARIDWAWDAGKVDANWEIQQITNVDGSPSVGEVSAQTGLDSAGGTSITTVGSNWPLGRNAVKLRLIRLGAGTVVPDDNVWGWFDNVCIRTILMSKQGTEYSTGYSTNTVRTNEVIEDLLGRRLPEYDGPNATIAATAVTIPHLAYMDGVTAAQVFEDIMQLEPAYRWYSTPDTTGGGYGFRWELWPTTVRYEATLDDGGSFPLSTQSLYNGVAVLWQDASGASRITFRSKACKILDDAGRTRVETISLGSEVGSASSAALAGDAFLDEHNVPKNSGTLTVARAIRDIISGRPVQPWEIEPGELVRIKGVEAYPDAFNANANDGQGVFRIFSVDYSSEGNVATLALDSDPREVEDVLVALINQQSRPSKRSKR